LKDHRERVRVQLVGGLGNQLFCYAFGRYLETLGHRVVFDTSEIDRGYTKHGVFLTDLNVTGEFRNFRKDLGATLYFLKRLSFGMQNKLQIKNWPRKMAKTYTAKEVGWDLRHESAAEPLITMRGYFASHRYFDAVRALDPSFGNLWPISGSSFFDLKARELGGRSWLAVHVRRGDYEALQDLYGLCGRNYFQEAYREILQRCEFEKVVVFSDDVEKAKVLLSEIFDKPTEYLNPPKDSKAEESLILMTLATCHIISNSSFSLWAAMLSETTEMVAYPSPWHKNMPTPYKLIPPTWVGVDSNFLDERH